MNESDLDLSRIADTSEPENIAPLHDGLSDDALGIDTSLLNQPRSEEEDPAPAKERISVEELKSQLEEMVAQNDSRLDPELKIWIQKELETRNQDRLDILLDIVSDVMNGEEHIETEDLVRRYSDKLLALISEDQRQGIDSKALQDRIMQSIGNVKDKGSIAGFVLDIFKSQFPELVFSSIKDPIALILSTLGGK